MSLSEKGDVHQENDLNGEQLLETITKYMDIQGYKALLCLYEGRIIMYIPSIGNQQVDMGKSLNTSKPQPPLAILKLV